MKKKEEKEKKKISACFFKQATTAYKEAWKASEILSISLKKKKNDGGSGKYWKWKACNASNGINP